MVTWHYNLVPWQFRLPYMIPFELKLAHLSHLAIQPDKQCNMALHSLTWQCILSNMTHLAKSLPTCFTWQYSLPNVVTWNYSLPTWQYRLHNFIPLTLKRAGLNIKRPCRAGGPVNLGGALS